MAKEDLFGILTLQIMVVLITIRFRISMNISQTRQEELLREILKEDLCQSGSTHENQRP